MFQDGEISLQDIVDQIDNSKYRVELRIYSDCCFSGVWSKQIESNWYQKKIKCNGKKTFWLKCHSSCGADELATELVFSNLLKGEKPDKNGIFWKVLEMRDKEVQGQTVRYGACILSKK